MTRQALKKSSSLRHSSLTVADILGFLNRHYLAESVRIVKLRVMKYRKCSHVTLHLDCITSTACMDEKIKYLVNATVPFFSIDSKPKKPFQTYFEMICF